MKSDNNKKYTPAVYLRVSKKDQEDGYGLEFQLDDCTEALTEDGLTLSTENVFSDSVSGKNDARADWQRLIEVAKKGEINVIYFWKLDRMMRDEYYYYFNEKMLNDLGVELRYATQDLSDPFHRAIQVALTAEERRRIIQRTKKGRETAIKNGKWAWGTPTYGYKFNREECWPEIWEEQAKWVKKIFEWLVYEQCSLKEITKRLNSNKIPTWTQSTKTKRRVSQKWWPRTVGRMLINEIYTGETHFSKYKKSKINLNTIDDENCLRDEDEWIHVKVPPIISKELFKKAVKQLRSNSEFAKRKKIRSYMFSGLLHCSKCGFKLSGRYAKPTSKTAKGSRNYVGYTLKRDVGNTKKCNYCGTIAESRLMPVWDVLKNALSDPEVIYNKIKRYAERDKTDSAKERMLHIDKALKSLTEDERRLNIAYLDTQTIDETEYKRRLRDHKRKRIELESEQEKTSNFIISEEEKISRIDAINQMYLKIKSNLETASYETQDKLIHLFVGRIDLTLESNSAEVEFHFPNEFLRNDNRGRKPD